MSRTLEMEPQQPQSSAETLRKLQELARQQDAFDSEAALHIRLLAETDAKLDRISAHLGRVGAEMGRLENLLQQFRHPSAVPTTPSRPVRGLAALCFFVLIGVLAGVVFTEWRYEEGGTPSQARYLPAAGPSSATALSQPLTLSAPATLPQPDAGGLSMTFGPVQRKSPEATQSVVNGRLRF